MGVQVSKRELHTHIHLDYTIIEFLFCIKKKKKPTSVSPKKNPSLTKTTNISTSKKKNHKNIWEVPEMSPKSMAVPHWREGLQIKVLNTRIEGDQLSWWWRNQGGDEMSYKRKLWKKRRKCTFEPYVLTIFLFWPLLFYFITFSS